MVTPKPRIRFASPTGRWQARCAPCRLTLSADHWQTVTDDTLRHLESTSHRVATVAALLTRTDTTGGTR